MWGSSPTMHPLWIGSAIPFLLWSCPFHICSLNPVQQIDINCQKLVQRGAEKFTSIPSEYAGAFLRHAWELCIPQLVGVQRGPRSWRCRAFITTCDDVSSDVMYLCTELWLVFIPLWLFVQKFGLSDEEQERVNEVSKVDRVPVVTCFGECCNRGTFSSTLFVGFWIPALLFFSRDWYLMICGLLLCGLIQ